MKNKYLYNMQFATLLFFLIDSFFINVGYNILTINNTDGIFDIIIGGVFIIIFLIIILYIKANLKQDIISKIMSLKFLKYPLSFILIIILGIITIYSLNNLTSYIHFYVLKEVNNFTISITLILISLYLVKKEIPTITRISEICFFIYILVFLLGFIGLYKYIDLNNLKPLFISKLENHLNISLQFFYYSIIPISLLLGLRKKADIRKNNILLIIFSSISILIFFLQLVLIISVLGINLTKIYQNPEMMIYKKISFLNIFERVEVFFSFNQLLNGLFITVINIYFIKKIIMSLINKKRELTILTLLGLIILFFTNIISISLTTYLIINITIFFIILIIFIRIIIHKHILHSEDLS